MTKSRFPKQVAEDLLVKSGRRCCLCQEKKGGKIQVHHIILASEGGPATADNGIVLCLDCHSEVHAYSGAAPIGKNFSPSELKRHRDQWFETFGRTGGVGPSASEVAEELLQRFMAKLPPGEGATNVGIEELTKAADLDTQTRLREAIELQRQHKEREAIDCLYEAFRRDLEPQAKAELHILIGNAFLRIGHLTEAQGHLRQGLEIAEQKGLTSQHAAALTELGILEASRSNFAEAEQLVEDALRIGGESDPDRATTLGALGNVYFHKGDFEEARSLYETALAAFRTTGRHQGEAEQLGNLGNVLLNQGLLTEAAECYSQALEIFTERGDRIGWATALLNLGNVHRKMGAHARAEVCYQEAREQYQDLDHVVGQAKALSGLGNIRMLENRLDEAREMYARALSLYDNTEHNAGMISLLSNLSGIYSAQRQFTEAETLLSQALALSERTGEKLMTAGILGNIGFIALAQGETKRGCDLLARASELYAGIGAGGEGPERVRATLKEMDCEEEKQEA